MHVGIYLHMLICYDICCAFEEPHATVNVVLPYWFSTQSVQLTGHVYAVRVNTLQEGVLVNQFRSRQSDGDHSDVVMTFSVKLGNELFLPCR